MYASNPAGDASAAITPSISITSSASRDALLQAYLQSRPGARETPRHQRRSRKPGFYGFERSKREPEQAAKRRASVQRRLSVLQQEQRGPGRGQGQGQGRARAFTTGGAGAEESKGAAESPSSSAQASALPAAAPILQRALTDEAKQVAGRLMINDQMQLFMTKNNLKNDLRKKRISVRTYRAEEVEAGRSFNRLYAQTLSGLRDRLERGMITRVDSLGYARDSNITAEDLAEAGKGLFQVSTHPRHLTDPL
mmetsp:Transcript_9530/g.22543  ORF Transcript_9530/g.22543 Transcript_9530/m.22543 type:complete len:252 (+) Transcript_9530:247-1002(+)